MSESEKKKVYLESTIFGYLTGRPSAIPKTAYWQALTRQWWEICRPKVDCFISRWVISESEDGDADAVECRMSVLKDFPAIRPNAEKVAVLAQQLIQTHALPEKEVVDAFHIATATVDGMDYLLTWNCKHLANYVALPKTYAVLTEAGYNCPVIITPEKYLEECQDE